MTPESAAHLIAFLGARWDEEEAELDQLMSGALVQGYLRAHGERLKAEIATKRRIVAKYAGLDADPNRLTYAFAQQQWVTLRAVVAALAQPYAGREDFDPAWSI